MGEFELWFCDSVIRIDYNDLGIISFFKLVCDVDV